MTSPTTALSPSWASRLERPSAVFVMIAWAGAAVAAAARIALRLRDPVLPGVPWQSGTGQMVDFRDLVYGPGRFLLGGGNPYDPATYVATHPWAQEFDPYAPAWLLLSPVGLLPFQVGAVVYALIMLGVGVLTVRTLYGWLCPSLAALGVPISLLWMNIWYPGRGALENGGTAVCALGLVLVLRGVADGRGVRVVAAAAGTALALIKPQFGIPVLIVALAGGRWDAVWRGVVGLVVASLPAGIASVVAAGGPARFVAAVLRDVAYASSPAAPTSLVAPNPSRIDLLGELARLGAVAPPIWQLIVPVAALAVLAFAGMRRTDPLAHTTLVTATILLGAVHLPYDLVIVIVPVIAGLGLVAVGRRLGLVEALTWIAVLVPFVHVHAITRVLLPGLGDPFPDIVDSAALVVAAMLAAVILARRPTVSPRPQGVPP